MSLETRTIHICTIYTAILQLNVDKIVLELNGLHVDFPDLVSWRVIGDQRRSRKQ